MLTIEQLVEKRDKKIAFCNENPNSKEAKQFMKECSKLNAEALDIKAALSLILQQELTHEDICGFLSNIAYNLWQMRIAMPITIDQITLVLKQKIDDKIH